MGEHPPTTVLNHPQETKKSAKWPKNWLNFFKKSCTTKKNFKTGTLEGFEKTRVLYVAMAEKPLSSGQKRFLGFGAYFVLQSVFVFSFRWSEVPFPRYRDSRERTPPGAEREERWSDLWGRFRALNDRPARRQRMASPLSTSSSDSSHATSSPSSPSDTSLVVDNDGRPIIPAPVEPLPLNLTGVLMILIKI